MRTAIRLLALFTLSPQSGMAQADFECKPYYGIIEGARTGDYSEDLRRIEHFGPALRIWRTAACSEHVIRLGSSTDAPSLNRSCDELQDELVGLENEIDACARELPQPCPQYMKLEQKYQETRQEFVDRCGQ